MVVSSSNSSGSNSNSSDNNDTNIHIKILLFVFVDAIDVVVSHFFLYFRLCFVTDLKDPVIAKHKSVVNYVTSLSVMQTSVICKQR